MSWMVEMELFLRSGKRWSDCGDCGDEEDGVILEVLDFLEALDSINSATDGSWGILYKLLLQ